MLKTSDKTETWKRFKWSLDGSCRIFTEAELIQVHPELSALVRSLSQEDNLNLSIETGLKSSNTKVHIQSAWEIRQLP